MLTAHIARPGTIHRFVLVFTTLMRLKQRCASSRTMKAAPRTFLSHAQNMSSLFARIFALPSTAAGTILTDTARTARIGTNQMFASVFTTPMRHALLIASSQTRRDAPRSSLLSVKSLTEV